MTEDIRRFHFLLKQQPFCSQSPIKVALGPDLHRELRAKYKLELGVDLLEDRCPNTFNCQLVNDGCVGRPFPNDSNILSALEGLNVEIFEGQFRGLDVVYAKATTCSICPFKESCTDPCVTEESYLNRSVRPDLSPKGPMLVNYEDFERGMFGDSLSVILRDDLEDYDVDDSWRTEQLPLDCLTPNQRQVIEMIDIQGLEQVKVASELGISQSAVSQMYQSALTRLTEFGKARRVIKDKGATLRVKMYYIDNLTEQQIADKIGIAQKNVNRALNKWRELNGIN